MNYYSTPTWNYNIFNYNEYSSTGEISFKYINQINK